MFAASVTSEPTNVSQSAVDGLSRINRNMITCRAGRRRMPGERIAPAPERAGTDRHRRFLSLKLEVKTNIHGKGRTI